VNRALVGSLASTGVRSRPSGGRAHERGEAPRAIPFLKRFTVFNIEQCQGAPCRREKGVIRSDLGKPKLSYVHQSHRMPKGSRDHSMTGARP
jgi:hypothetical protein